MTHEEILKAIKDRIETIDAEQTKLSAERQRLVALSGATPPALLPVLPTPVQPFPAPPFGVWWVGENTFPFAPFRPAPPLPVPFDLEIHTTCGQTLAGTGPCLTFG